jgi:transposase-like protein
MITDKLASYAAAKKVDIPGVEHRQHKGLNNRGEFSSADPPARTHHEALQISRTGATLSLDA